MYFELFIPRLTEYICIWILSSYVLCVVCVCCLFQIRNLLMGIYADALIKFYPFDMTKVIICPIALVIGQDARIFSIVVLTFVTDPDEDPRYWYNLAGVVVHTGTADGGHYYSFIRDRYSTAGSWYLFNDAEVKPFDPSQIAAECFGGEMMVDQKIMIYVLFYTLEDFHEGIDLFSYSPHMDWCCFLYAVVFYFFVLYLLSLLPIPISFHNFSLNVLE